jgi:predicted nucleic acid-binding Zn ribbon protein
MPIYIYETIPADGSEPAEPARFEIMQRIADPALTEYPETGEPVRRVITAPALALKHSSGREREVPCAGSLREQSLLPPSLSLGCPTAAGAAPSARPTGRASRCPRRRSR